MADSNTPKRGGTRPGAGRKSGSGSYGEPTESVRIPLSLLPIVKAWLAARLSSPPADALRFAASQAVRRHPLFSSQVPAGGPTAGDDHVDDDIDLNEHLVQHPNATFFVRVKGDSMIGAGISDGDLLVVDRSVEPRNGQIVVAAVNGEQTVKRLKIEQRQVWLMPENPAYRPLEIGDGMDLVIWGVVAHAVHSF
ncbi:MAG: translesion error-prone DNA polymerase V autoproteolytic subunit [Methylococcaceae bacterium]|nr:translesion error-prone DNA polymerase V autoproteolytic subunit [Methylococcaceae bacterium]